MKVGYSLINEKDKKNDPRKNLVSETYADNFNNIQKFFNIGSTPFETDEIQYEERLSNNEPNFTLRDGRIRFQHMSQADSINYHKFIKKIDDFLGKQDSLSYQQKDNINSVLNASGLNYYPTYDFSDNKKHEEIESKLNKLSTDDIKRISEFNFSEFKDMNMFQKIKEVLKIKPKNISVFELIEIGNYLGSEEGVKRYPSLHMINNKYMGY